MRSRRLYENLMILRLIIQLILNFIIVWNKGDVFWKFSWSFNRNRRRTFSYVLSIFHFNNDILNVVLYFIGLLWKFQYYSKPFRVFIFFSGKFFCFFLIFFLFIIFWINKDSYFANLMAKFYVINTWFWDF